VDIPQAPPEFPNAGTNPSIIRRLHFLPLGDFPGPHFRDPFDQLHGDRLGKREADRSLADLVRREFILEGRHDMSRGGIERVVPPPRGEIEHRAAVQFVRGDVVRDNFLSLGQGMTDTAPHAIEDTPHRLGLRRDVLIHGLELGLGHQASKYSLFRVDRRSGRVAEWVHPAVRGAWEERDGSLSAEGDRSL